MAQRHLVFIPEPGEALEYCAKEAWFAARETLRSVYLIFNDTPTYSEPTDSDHRGCMERWSKLREEQNGHTS